MKYDKLVRDKIPEYIRGKGGVPVCHVADAEEYRRKLKEKLTEEVGEYLKDENIEELADVLEVIDAIVAERGFSRDEIDRVKEKKATERGRFQERIILDES